MYSVCVKPETELCQRSGAEHETTGPWFVRSSRAWDQYVCVWWPSTVWQALLWHYTAAWPYLSQGYYFSKKKKWKTFTMVTPKPDECRWQVNIRWPLKKQQPTWCKLFPWNCDNSMQINHVLILGLTQCFMWHVHFLKHQLPGDDDNQLLG